MNQETSKIAYREDVLPTLGERQVAVYDVLEKSGKDMTNLEIAQALQWPINTVTPRVFELRKTSPPLVEEYGKRKCSISGRTAIAWTVVRDTLF